MSRGHGKVQRAIMDMFKKSPDQELESFIITAYVFEDITPSQSHLNSANRALRKLAESGHVEDLGHNEYGRKMYGLPGRNKRFKNAFCLTDVCKKLESLSK